MPKQIVAVVAFAAFFVGSAIAQLPDTVFLDEFTWTEVRDLIDNGTTTVIVATAGTEQNGPHMVLGKHKFIVSYAAEQIARRLGDTLVWENRCAWHQGPRDYPIDQERTFLRTTVRGTPTR